MSKLYFSTMLHFSPVTSIVLFIFSSRIFNDQPGNSLLFQLSWGFTSNRWSLILSSKMTTDFYFYRSFPILWAILLSNIQRYRWSKDMPNVLNIHFAVHWAGYCILLKYKPLLLTLIKSNFLCLGCEFY